MRAVRAHVRVRACVYHEKVDADDGRDEEEETDQRGDVAKWHGLYSHGLVSDGLCSSGLHSYGLYSHGLYSHGLYSHDL